MNFDTPFRLLLDWYVMSHDIDGAVHRYMFYSMFEHKRIIAVYDSKVDLGVAEDTWFSGELTGMCIDSVHINEEASDRSNAWVREHHWVCETKTLKKR